MRFSELPVVAVQATPSAEREAWEPLMWLGAILLGGLLLLWAVRTMLKRRNRPDNLFGLSFSLDELRGLRDRGELTVDEYEVLRKKVIAAASATPVKSRGKTPGS